MELVPNRLQPSPPLLALLEIGFEKKKEQYSYLSLQLGLLAQLVRANNAKVMGSIPLWARLLTCKEDDP